MIGQTLSHYRIIEKIGQGGMGEVYKAQDLHLDRFVAIKMLPRDKVADPERRHRFIQEAKSASALNHPNIITIHDIDEVDGNYFIAMEYVPGKTLHELIRSGDLRLGQSLDYAIQIGDALAKAHSAGIIHRDIKPSNVMITDNNHAKVLDFGLAKLAGWPEGKEEDITLSLESITEEGKILGTLSYMSPEQARGREVDQRTDIFSLGVVLYQMITRELPFRGPHAAAILDKLLYSPTPSLKNTVSNLPDALEQTVDRATAKNPGDRYQHMQEMVSDLRSISSTGELARPFPKKKRRRSLILAFVAIVLVLLLALQFRDRLPRWLGGTPLPDQILLAVLPFNNVSGDEESRKICDGLMMMLVNKLTQIESFRESLSIISSNEVRNRNIDTPAGARNVLAANMTLEGSLLNLSGQSVLTINLVDTDTLRQIDAQTCRAPAGDLIALGNEAFEKVFAMLKLKLNLREQQVLSAGETGNQSANKSYVFALHYMARYDVIENIDRAILYFQQAIQEDPQYALAYAGLGEAYWAKYERLRERKWMDLALSNCRKAAELETLMAAVHKTMGIIYTGTGQPEKALDELNLAIKIEPGNAEAYQEMGNAYQRMNRFGEAEVAYRTSIELKPDSWSGYFSLGVFYYNRARYEEAIEQFHQVLQLVPDHSVAFSALGAIYAHEGDFESAVRMFSKSLAVRESPEAYSNLASIYILQGRSPEAVPLLEKAKDMEGATYEIWGNLGEACSLTPGLSDKAPAAYTRAAELVAKDLEVNPKDILAEAKLAYYLIRLGNKKQALETVARIGDSARENPNVLFRSALVYERAGDREKALSALSAAAAKGYSRAIIQAASDLDQLRKDPRYHDLFEGQETR